MKTKIKLILAGFIGVLILGGIVAFRPGEGDGPNTVIIRATHAANKKLSNIRIYDGSGEPVIVPLKDYTEEDENFKITTTTIQKYVEMGYEVNAFTHFHSTGFTTYTFVLTIN